MYEIRLNLEETRTKSRFITFILKFQTGTDVRCFGPLDALWESHRGRWEEANLETPRSETPLVQHSTGPAVGGSGRRQTAATQTGFVNEPPRPTFTPTVPPVNHLEV